MTIYALTELATGDVEVRHERGSSGPETDRDGKVWIVDPGAPTYDPATHKIEIQGSQPGTTLVYTAVAKSQAELDADALAASLDYIPARKQAYIAALAKRLDDGAEEALGYTVDIILTEMQAMRASAPATQEYTDLVAEVATIKAAIPKD
jgi:phage baseplate assembly protein gpV